MEIECAPRRTVAGRPEGDLRNARKRTFANCRRRAKTRLWNLLPRPVQCKVSAAAGKLKIGALPLIALSLPVYACDMRRDIDELLVKLNRIKNALDLAYKPLFAVTIRFFKSSFRQRVT